MLYFKKPRHTKLVKEVSIDQFIAIMLRYEQFNSILLIYIQSTEQRKHKAWEHQALRKLQFHVPTGRR